MSVRAVLSFMGLQLGWFACVLGAARGYPWLGPVVVLVALSMHVGKQRGSAREIFFLGITAVVGFVVDTALLRFGVLRIPGTTISPPWLVALWPNFISTTAEGGLLSSLPRRPLLASLLGAVGGPAAYDAGARLGAIELGSHRLVTLAIVGVVWAVVVPALVLLRARVVTPFAHTSAYRQAAP
jgi:hypothetical protein